MSTSDSPKPTPGRSGAKSSRLKSWTAPQASAPLNAVIAIPGSKSLTNRELVLAALASEPSLLRLPLHSRDTDLMVQALKALGVSINTVSGNGEYGPNLMVLPPEEFLAGQTIDCGLAGTVMRFIPPLAALAAGDTFFTGDEESFRRPMSGVTDALRALGATTDPEDAQTLPFTVSGTGEVIGGELEVDSSASSQFVSALLMVAPRFREGLTLRHTGEKLPSLPHIEMTIETLRNRGVTVISDEPGTWRVESGPIGGRNLTIEPDLSNAAPFLAAALVSGGQVTIRDWPEHTTQAGAALVELLQHFGAIFEKTKFGLTINGGEGVVNGAKLPGVDLDLSAVGELSPTIVGLAALAESPSTITGIGHLRGHETDRLAALVAELKALGVEAEELEDGIRVTPTGKLKPVLWHSYYDHRIATTGALIGLAVPGLRVQNIETTAKTFPEFPVLWKKVVLT